MLDTTGHLLFTLSNLGSHWQVTRGAVGHSEWKNEIDRLLPKHSKWWLRPCFELKNAKIRHVRHKRVICCLLGLNLVSTVSSQVRQRVLIRFPTPMDFKWKMMTFPPFRPPNSWQRSYLMSEGDLVFTWSHWTSLVSTFTSLRWRVQPIGQITKHLQIAPKTLKMMT